MEVCVYDREGRERDKAASRGAMFTIYDIRPQVVKEAIFE